MRKYDVDPKSAIAVAIFALATYGFFSLLADLNVVSIHFG